MRKPPKLFIETTVFNFYFEGKQGQKQKDFIRLFDEITKGRYEAYASEAVFRELEATQEEKRGQMLSLYRRYIQRTIIATDEAELLAETYIGKGIIPEKYWDDALHIAIATVNNLDFVISFSQGHNTKGK